MNLMQPACKAEKQTLYLAFACNIYLFFKNIYFQKIKHFPFIYKSIFQQICRICSIIQSNLTLQSETDNISISVLFKTDKNRQANGLLQSESAKLGFNLF